MSTDTPGPMMFHPVDSSSYSMSSSAGIYANPTQPDNPNGNFAQIPHSGGHVAAASQLFSVQQQQQSQPQHQSQQQQQQFYAASNQQPPVASFDMVPQQQQQLQQHIQSYSSGSHNYEVPTYPVNGAQSMMYTDRQNTALPVVAQQQPQQLLP
ncbi:unnamed protein product [Schistosoma turkestanicum]|nr:unnamed protein product [Schistosoma turkestanicum]